MYGTTKTLNNQSNPEKKRTKPEVSHFLTSNHATRKQQSKPHGICRKTDTSAQWDRIESTEINPHVCRQVVFVKGAKNIPQKASSINGAGKIESPRKRMKLDCYVSPYTKIDTKWIKDLKRPETMNYILKENICNKMIFSSCNLMTWQQVQDRNPEQSETAY